MDILRLLDDHKIEYLTSGHKHCTQGWVNVHCPWCEGSKNFHLGFDMAKEIFVCWRCGWHPTADTIAKLLGASPHETYAIMKQYGGRRVKSLIPAEKEIDKRPFQFPTDTEPLKKRHKDYLEKRGFDPERTEREWNLLGTGPSSYLEGVNFSHRIIIPIYWEGKVVSFQGRDITGRSERKYLACPPERELINLKKILYRHPDSLSDRCICVEGVTDVWRIGRSAVATFGIKYTPRQLRLLMLYERVVLWYDDEVQAQEQARKLEIELLMKSKEAMVKRVALPGDPGSAPKAYVEKVLRMLDRYTPQR